MIKYSQARRFGLHYARMIVLFFATSFSFLAAHSQDPNSGNTLMQYNRSANQSTSTAMPLGVNLGVDLYKGQLQASIPVYTLPSSELSIPIAIDYAAGGGIKLQDQNTSVGLGWTLNASGSISRVVRGIPDESTYGYIGPNNQGLNVVNVFSNPGTGHAINFNNIWNTTKLSPTPIVDGEPDVFYIQTPTLDLRFTIDANGNAVTQNNTGVKIVHSLYNNTNGSNTGMVVTDDQGNQYYFGSTAASRESTTTSFFGQSFTFTSTWYLDKIVTYNAKDVISFSYMQGPSDTVYFHTLSKEFISTYASSLWTPAPPTSTSQVNTRFPDLTTLIYNQPKYISQIITKMGEADFSYTYNSNPHINANNPPELTSIAIKALNPLTYATSTLIETFNLSYIELEDGIIGAQPPFPNNPTYYNLWSDFYRRLLNTLTVTGTTPATSSPLTLFTLKYNQDKVFPNRSLPQNCDYWGFVNSLTWAPDAGGDNFYFTDPTDSRQPGWYLNPPNNAPIPMASLLMLNEIDNLAGDNTRINYEPNDYYNAGIGFNDEAGGCRVYNITHNLATGQQQYLNYTYLDQNFHSTGVLYNDFYTKVNMAFGNFSSGCCNLETIAMSQSPYSFTDENGLFMGYSSAKVQDQSGGSTVYSYSNFNNYPDVLDEPIGFADGTFDIGYNTEVGSQVSSFAYKRGLLTSSVIFNSSGALLSEADNTFSSLDGAPVKNEFGIQDMTWSEDPGSPAILASVSATVNVYNSNFENWRLTKSVKKEYDQKNISNFIQTTTNYAYCPNNRLVQTITTTDSKGSTLTKQFFHADDAGIPMVTAGEQTAITAMVSANRSNVTVHEIDIINNAKKQIHNSYSAGQITGNKGVADVFLINSTGYNTNLSNSITTQASQQQFNYDYSTANLSTSSSQNGVPVSYQYDYNTCYPVAKVENASTSSASSTGTTTLAGFLATSGTFNVTSGLTGTISFSLSLMGNPGTNGALSVTYSLVGPSNAFGVTCVGIPSATCSPTITVNVPNMAAGAYTIYLSVSSNTGIYPGLECIITYPVFQVTNTNEFYYQGFEQGVNGVPVTTGAAHSGNGYYNATSAPFNVNFNLPNTRSYVMQYFKLVSGAWVLNEAPYTGPTSLSGIIDDIRIFPADALMTTYTYNPLVGLTSETDPGGKVRIYQYDGLNRLQTVRDQDNNILKQYDYEYQLLAAPVYNTVQSGSYTKTNCPTGYTGLPVTYTVPANTYSSYISVVDANQKALADVQANGPNYANAQSTASACRAPTLIVSGPTSALSGMPTQNGTISGTPGNTVHVSMGAGGAPGYSLSMTVKSGSTVIGSGTCTTPSSSFTFVMPASGTASYSLSYSGTQGGGSFSVSY